MTCFRPLTGRVLARPTLAFSASRWKPGGRVWGTEGKASKMSLSRKLEAGENSEFESPGDIQDVGRVSISTPSGFVSGDSSEGKESERLSCDDSYNEPRSDTA